MNTPVSFEIAKLLKEKGFDLYCVWSYWNSELTSHTPGYALEDGTTSQENYWDFDRYYAPTIAEVVMWLYEKHGIWISVYCDCYGILWYANLSVASEKNWDNIDLRHEIISAFKKFPNEHNSPIEAYEEAIKYTLNNLI